MNGNQENAISGKQKDSVQQETRVVSPNEIIRVDSQHSRPLLLQDRRHKMTEENLRKETPLGEVVHPEREVKNRARICSEEHVRNRRVLHGLLPYVYMTSLNRDAKSATSVCSLKLKLTVSPVKSRRQVVGKGQ